MSTNFDTGNPSIAYISWSSSLVLLMSPGVAILYAGLSRSSSALSILALCLMSMAIITIQWVLFGFSLAFSETGSAFIGDFYYGLFENMIGQNVLSTTAPAIPTILFAFYQMQFATVTGTIVFGSVAERIRLMPAFLFIFLWSTIVYCPIAYWTWGAKGWLKNLSCLGTDSPCGIGVYDYAGGGPVHVGAGFAGLAYCLFVGKRQQGIDLKPHSINMVILGTSLLWFGWLGFNGGSSLASTTRGVVAATVTTIAGSSGAITWVFMEYFRVHRVSAMAFCNGALAGLATITPASGYVAPWASIVIGILASVICYFGVRIKEWLRFDDTFDAWGVHGIGGFVGLLLAGIFAQKSIAKLDGSNINGGWLDGNFIQMGYQLAAAVSIAAWSFAVSIILLYLINLIPTMHLRLDKVDEMKGADSIELVEYLGNVNKDSRSESQRDNNSLPKFVFHEQNKEDDSGEIKIRLQQ